MRTSEGLGFARCAYRNARRMEELIPLALEYRRKEAEASAALDKEPDVAYEEELARRRAEGDMTPLIRMTMRFPGPEEQELEECAGTVVVMAHMAIEAYIYDLAGRELGDDVAEELDKLSPLGKWLVIPRLVSAYALVPGAEPYNRLKRLTKIRNKLAHPKSREVSDPEAPRKGINIVDEARSALRTLEALRTEAELFDDSGSPEMTLSDFAGGFVLSKETRTRIEAQMAAEKAQNPSEPNER